MLKSEITAAGDSDTRHEKWVPMCSAYYDYIFKILIHIYMYFTYLCLYLIQTPDDLFQN